jgi:site-specific recombinase XerD
VGEAIADYLRRGRPHTTSRQVFLTARPPFVGFPRSSTADGIIHRALKKAGLKPPRQGTYLLRHTVATEMLRKGSSLAEIGELLRHRHPDTTAIYAKVDLASLRGLAVAWPEVKAHE